MKHCHVAATLTRADLEAPFALGDLDAEPLPKPSRAALEWDGARWAEIDPATGTVLAIGDAATNTGEAA